MTTKELIKAVKNEKGSAFQNCRDCEYGTHNGEVIEKLNRLAELENGIEQGTIIELPCKVGDTVYSIYKFPDYNYEEDISPYEIFEVKVERFYIDKELIDVEFNKPFIGKAECVYVAYTREEAEKRLRGLQNG